MAILDSRHFNLVFTGLVCELAMMLLDEEPASGADPQGIRMKDGAPTLQNANSLGTNFFAS